MMAWRATCRWLVIALALATPLLSPSAADAAAPKFPQLTGRVVDGAGIITPDAEAGLTNTLASFERDTKRQVVVVTVPDLQGLPIEEYGVQLGRHWGIGEKDKNSGALLIVAPKDRAVRIEVGYGLEGELTDAISRQIIDRDILPHFRAGDFNTGVIAGTFGMLRALGWEGAGPVPTAPPQHYAGPEEVAIPFAITLGFFLFILFLNNYMARRRGPWDRGGFYRSGGSSSSFGRSSSSSGGGFRGGGGSFGGGGASGRW